MATVLRIEGYIVRIWSNDHLPRHVHIFKGNGECVINLLGEGGNPELREFYGMKRKEVAKAIRIVCAHQEKLIAEWNRIHGEYKHMTQLTEQQIEDQIDRAIANQAKIDAVEPRANQVLFKDGRIILHFNNGAIFSFLASSVEAIANLSPKILATVELTPSGKGLRWDEPDIDLSIQGLLLGILGSNIWMKEIAAKGGKSTSEKKQAASRENGKKGGRPKKVYY